MRQSLPHAWRQHFSAMILSRLRPQWRPKAGCNEAEASFVLDRFLDDDSDCTCADSNRVAKACAEALQPDGQGCTSDNCPERETFSEYGKGRNRIGSKA